MAAESTSAQTDSVPSERANANEAVVRRLIKESLGSGNLTITNDALAPDYANHVDGLPELPPGPTGFERFVTQLRRALFDLDVTIDGVVAHDADVAVHWTARGRLERPFLGMEPACVIGCAGQEPGGTSATLSAVTVARLEQSKVRESHTRWTSIRRHPN